MPIAQVEPSVVSVSTQVMLIYSRSLAVDILDSGLLIKFAVLPQPMVLHSTAKLNFQPHKITLPTGIFTLASVLEVAINKEPLIIAVDVLTGTKRESKSQASQTLKYARAGTKTGTQLLSQPLNG
jgi:hypothetical protein